MYLDTKHIFFMELVEISELYWTVLDRVLVPDEGLEPPTFGLQNRCTTTVLIRHGKRMPRVRRRHSIG